MVLILLSAVVVGRLPPLSTSIAQTGNASQDLFIRAIPVASGLHGISDITNAGDERLFVAELYGVVVILEPGSAGPHTTFLDIRDRVSSNYGEQGLLSIVFHPSYADNGHFYVAYTDLAGDAHIARFQVSQDSNIADPDSEMTLLVIPQASPEHNLGELAFGPDGYLYAAIGDGGSMGDPDNNGQNTGTLKGSILRLDVDSESPYAIPPDNPFVNDPLARGEIWAHGLRNPWRFSFDRQSGDLYIADVGHHSLEEVNWEPAGEVGGRNYGWRCYEGSQEYDLTGCDMTQLYTMPVFEYNHGVECAIIGGYVYRGSSYPELNGQYLYADFCASTINSIERDEQGDWSVVQATRNEGVFWNTFGEDNAGELFAAGWDGNLYQIIMVSGELQPGAFLPIARRP